MLTVVIPTRNNQSYLNRLISYYRDQSLKHKILIADSSDSGQLANNKHIVDSSKADLDIEYLQYQPDLTVPNKLSDALRQVDTPYTALGADDDLFVPAGLSRAVDFLEDHADFALAHGDAIIFNVCNDGTHGPIGGTFRYEQRTIDQPTGAQRLVDNFSHYATVWYSVYRTETLQSQQQKITVSLLDRPYFEELLPSALAVIQGKTKKLDGLYMVRQVHSQRRQQAPDVFDWISDSSWSDHYQRFLDCASEELTGQDRISLEDAKGIVKQAFWIFVAQGLTVKWPQQYDQNSSGANHGLRQISDKIPGLLKVLRQMRSLLPGEENEVSLPALLRPGSKYHSDFMPIYQAITQVPSVIEIENPVNA